MSIDLPLDVIKTTLSCLQETETHTTPAPLPNVWRFMLFLFSFLLATISFAFKRTQLLNPTCAFFCVSVVIWPNRRILTTGLLRDECLESDSSTSRRVRSHLFFRHISLSFGHLFVQCTSLTFQDAYCTLKLNHDWTELLFLPAKISLTKSLRWRSNHCGLQLCQSTRCQVVSGSDGLTDMFFAELECKHVNFPKVSMHFQ